MNRFSGLTAAIQLKKKLGIVAQVYEGTKDIGGTWNYNTYPGCACKHNFVLDVTDEN